MRTAGAVVEMCRVSRTTSRARPDLLGLPRFPSSRRRSGTHEDAAAHQRQATANAPLPHVHKMSDGATRVPVPPDQARQGAPLVPASGPALWSSAMFPPRSLFGSESMQPSAALLIAAVTG